jgi:RNA polymerase sigma-54 factor
MLKQQLAQKQQLKLLPQQLMLVKLLESTTAELDERIVQELESNPALEEISSEEAERENDAEVDIPEIDKAENTIDLSEYAADDDIPDYKLKINNYSKDDKQEEIPFSADMTFYEYLQNQVGLHSLSEKMVETVYYVIGNIDSDGYLRRKTEDMRDDLLFQNSEKISAKEIEDAIRIIQTFDPAGVCAHSLQECLSLQLKRKEETESLRLALDIVEHHFDDLAHKNYDKIIAELRVDNALLQHAFHEILRLNPKPGSAWSTLMDRNKEVVIPDFNVENDNGHLVVTLNDRNRHVLRVSDDFQQMQRQLAKQKEASRQAKEAVFYVKQQIESAEMFIDSLQRRNITLLSTMNAIVEMQRPFFLEGDESLLRPMILKDIAEKTGLDVSTISRVSNSKYVQTEFGTFRLKFFFIQTVQTESGEELSTHAIKLALQHIVDNEDKKHPLKDDEIATLLAEQGFDIARRTVAKYRAQMGIPMAQMRREITIAYSNAYSTTNLEEETSNKES